MKVRDSFPQISEVATIGLGLPVDIQARVQATSSDLEWLRSLRDLVAYTPRELPCTTTPAPPVVCKI